MGPGRYMTCEDSPLQTAVIASMRGLIITNEVLRDDDFSGADGRFNYLSEVLATLF